MDDDDRLDLLAGAEWLRDLPAILPDRPTMAVVGCYQGRLLDYLTEAMPAYQYAHGYDPQTWAIERARARLAGRDRVMLHDYGLAAMAGTVRLYEAGTDAAGVHRTTREYAEGMMVDGHVALAAVLPLDLMVVNIEGGEFELLPHLLDHGDLAQVRLLAVQWHMGLGFDDDYLPLLARLDAGFGPRVWENAPAWIIWKR